MAYSITAPALEDSPATVSVLGSPTKFVDVFFCTHWRAKILVQETGVDLTISMNLFR